MPLNFLFIFLIMTTFSSYLWANSPPNISSDIPWTDTVGNEVDNTAAYGGVTDIVFAFNHARREEEKQLNLAVGSIADLVLPVQTVWDGMSDDEKMLYLLNDERVARAGIVSGVKGLPFAGIEASIDLIAENYANLLHDLDKTDHNQPSGDASIDNPFNRIDQDPVIGSSCHEFVSYSENLAFFVSYLSSGTPSVPLPIERSLYQWVYVNSISNWVHRKMVLLQDVTLSNTEGTSGFKNNNGATNHEGLIGVHRVSSAAYMPSPIPVGFNNYGVIVVFTFFDPVSNAEVNTQNCLYNVTLKTEDLNTFIASHLSVSQVADRLPEASVTSSTTGGGGFFSVQIMAFLALFAGVGFYRNRNNKQ